MKLSHGKIVVYGIAGMLLLVLPFLVRSIYFQNIINLVIINAIVISGMNIIMGFCGQFMLAQAAFYGVGAYTSAILSTKLGISFWICLPASVITASAAGLLTSLPCLRVKGHYLAIVSLGIAVVIHEAMVNLVDLTNGPGGILNIPSPSFFGISLDTDLRYYYLLLILAGISVLFVKIILGSRVGRAFIAIRESYTAAEAAGINHRLYKVIAFILSGSYAGLAGSLYAHLIQFVSPDTFGLSELLSELAMLVVGGIGTIAGPVIGAAILGFGYEYLRALHDLQMVIYGLIILIFVLFLPRGLVTLKEKLVLYAKDFKQRGRVSDIGS